MLFLGHGFCVVAMLVKLAAIYLFQIRLFEFLVKELLEKSCNAKTYEGLCSYWSACFPLCQCACSAFASLTTDWCISRNSGIRNLNCTLWELFKVDMSRELN